MEIMPKYIQLKTCSHKFCKDCKKSIEKECPICRKEFTKAELLKKDDTEKMEKEKINCLCEEEFNLLEFKDHYDECETIRKENDKAKTNLLDKTKMKKTVNRSTFGCPCCKTTNLDRKALVEHIRKKHKKNKGVCPICLSQPWGDPNISTHLASHMELRHQYDYDTYTDYQMNDDDILQKVLQQSLQDH